MIIIKNLFNYLTIQFIFEFLNYFFGLLNSLRPLSLIKQLTVLKPYPRPNFHGMLIRYAIIFISFFFLLSFKIFIKDSFY
jgi:hypothetical protein